MKSIIKCPYYYFESALPPEMCATIIELGQQKIQEDATKNLQKLMRAGIVSYYPVLDELGKGIVSQSEHTLLITNNGNEVLTG